MFTQLETTAESESAAGREVPADKLDSEDRIGAPPVITELGGLMKTAKKNVTVPEFDISNFF